VSARARSPAGPCEMQEGNGEMTKKTVLVVDDEIDVVEFLSQLLEDNGYRARRACDGVQAMERIEEERPDLILLDLQMPNETGTGLFRKLHDKKEYRDIPIVVISGLAGRDVAVSKSVPVIDKPPEEKEVLRQVSKALGEQP
jgi:CheY-like chemotaxis protein